MAMLHGQPASGGVCPAVGFPPGKQTCVSGDEREPKDGGHPNGKGGKTTVVSICCYCLLYISLLK